MQCDICGKKKATVHLTEIVDEQMTELHLCEDCAREKSVQMEQQFGLADLLAGLADFGKQVKGEDREKIQCPHCGMSYGDFRKFGRLGCSECYSAFKDQLDILLKKIHGANQHLGKSPLQVPAAVPAPAQKSSPAAKDLLQDLKDELQKAIQAEDFEKAAVLRDKVHEMEKKENKK
ncbi:MAG: UvrB/UvrC motif-containing protein [Candidatus Omnitrophota bacterium]